MDFTAQLPDDLLATIFSWLHTTLRFALLPTVCKHWQNVFSTNAICWHDIDLLNLKHQPLGCVLRSITMQYAGVQPPPVRILKLTLSLHDCVACPDDKPCCMPGDLYIAPLAKWRYLQELFIDHMACPTFVRMFMHTLSHTHYSFLRTLHIRYPIVMDADRDLDFFSIQAPSLTVLKVERLRCPNTDFRPPPSVRHLTLSQCHNRTLHLSDVNLLSLRLWASDFREIDGLDAQRDLQDITLYNIHMPQHEGLLMPQPLNPFSSLRSLVHVEITYMPIVMLQFLEHAASMRQLAEVCYTSGITSHSEVVGLLHMIRPPCRLKLVLSRVSLQDMHTLSRQANDTIVSLDISAGSSWSMAVDNTHQTGMADISCISAFTNLERLHITPSHPQLLSFLSRAHCPLRELSVVLKPTDTPSLTDISALVSLRVLSIDTSYHPGAHHRLSEQDAKAVASLPDLESLQIVCPSNVEAMRELCGCPSLRSLTLSKRCPFSKQDVLESAWLVCLNRLTHLSYVSLPELSNVDFAIGQLSTIPSITRLIFQHNRLSSEQRSKVPAHIQLLSS